jgi:hypothetical protein
MQEIKRLTNIDLKPGDCICLVDQVTHTLKSCIWCVIKIDSFFITVYKYGTDKNDYNNWNVIKGYAYGIKVNPDELPEEEA